MMASTNNNTDAVHSTSEPTITTATAQEQQQQQRQHLDSLSLNETNGTNHNPTQMDKDEEDTSMMAILTLQDITDLPPTPMNTEGGNEAYQSTSIPKVKFIDDIGQYIESFTPKLVTAELLIGAYTQLHTKYKLSETSLLRKRTCKWNDL
jgi:hypothetical protein